MAASIVVDIKAQITGYQEQITKIQSALDKLKIGSGIGKELSQELERVQRLVNELNRNTNIRITSDGGIDKLTDKLTRVGEYIDNIGTKMQTLTVGDLDFSKLDKEAQDTLREIEQLNAALNSKMTSGLQEKLQSAVDHGSRLGRVLQRVQADIKNLDEESTSQLLAQAFEDANTKAHETAKEIKDLRKEVKQYESDIGKLESSTLKDTNFNRQGYLEKLQNAKGVGKDKTFLDSTTGGAYDKLLSSWEQQLNAINFSAENAKSVIKDFFDTLRNTSDIDEAKQTLEDFKKLYDELGGKGQKKQFNSIFKTSDLTKAATTDINKVEEVKNTITTLLDQVQGDFNEGESAKAKQINSLINLNQIDKAREMTIKLITEAYMRIEQELEEKKAELANKLNTLDIKRGELGTHITERNEASAATQGFENIIASLTKENEALQQKLQVYEKLFGDQVKNQLDNINKSGGSISNKAKEALDEAAQSANIYKTELQQVQAREQLIGKIEGVVQRWFSIYAAVRMVGQAIRSVISTVQELDKTITEIAIVTDMTQDQLWGQMKSYTDMARQYAASISGVYQVSQLYYQQGLQ